MIVEFTIENFRSFKNETTFTMQTAPYLKKFSDTNTFQFAPTNILKNAVIFGPNGSGKSNVIEAMKVLESMVIRSYRLSKDKSLKLPFEPFKMNENNSEYTFFGITLFINNKLYNFQVKYNEDLIIYESLIILNKNENEVLYKREFDKELNNYTFEMSKKTPDMRDKLRKSVLYLSLLREFTNDFDGFIEGREVFDWFVNNLMIINADDHTRNFERLIKKLEDKDTKDNVLNFLKIADFNIIDIEIRKRKQEITKEIKSLLLALRSENMPEIEDHFEMIDIYTIYNMYNEDSEVIGNTDLHADSFESRGTLKMILISLVLLDAIDNGKTVFIDEFDNAFHLEISIFLLKVFNSSVYNNKSQFILNTHDISLMDANILRVDQVWFTEKSINNVTDLYSLYDFNRSNNQSRSDMSYARDYLKGRFGGLPIVNESFFNYNIFSKGE